MHSKNCIIVLIYVTKKVEKPLDKKHFGVYNIFCDNL